MPDTRLDWEQRGYCDYPRHDLFPYRDKHNEKDEKDYLRGWYKKSRDVALEATFGRD